MADLGSCGSLTIFCANIVNKLLFFYRIVCILVLILLMLLVFILIALIGKGIYDAVQGSNSDGASSKRRFFSNANHVDTDADADADGDRSRNRISMRTITEAIQRREGRESV